MNFGQTDEKLSVADGTEWICRQLVMRLPVLDAMIPDFYHLAGRVGSTAHTSFGEGGAKTSEWAKRLRTLAKDHGPAALVTEVNQTLKAVRAPSK